MNALVIGSGGREHAIAWALTQEDETITPFCAPGNPGIADIATCVPCSPLDGYALADLAERHAIDLVIVGPEAPLAAGIVDVLARRGVRAFGPTQAAAQIEASKVFMKTLCRRYEIPTAAFRVFDDPAEAAGYLRWAARPMVVKADGLAAGKGVVVAATADEGIAAVDAMMVARRFGEAGARVVIEEVLGLRRRGYEVECYAPTVDASRCYPDLLGEVRVKTFLPQLPRWFPFREAVQMAATSMMMPLYAWRFRGVDAIVGCNQPSAWIAWWAARLMDVPYVVYLNQPNRLVYPRNVDRQTGWVSNADYRLLAAVVLRATRFVAWADRRSIQEADQLLVNGNYIGDIIRKTYRRDAVDCPAGCHVAASGFPLPI